jgi:hypothetical protein
MADETILDKAMALIPGVGTPKKRKLAASRQAQLAAVKKNLAKLAKDVQKLATMIEREGKKPMPAKMRAAAGKPVGGKASARKTTRRKS